MLLLRNLTFVCVSVIALSGMAFADSAAGQVFKEYSYTKRWGETDPCATHPWSKRYNKRAEKVIEGVDLERAVKAELRVEYWGGHIGTGEQKFKVNSNDWIYVPQPVNTPTNPVCYYRTILGNPPVEVPLSHLKPDKNVFQFTAGPQIKYDFGWGWYHIYTFTLRVYYDLSKPHPTGKITFPYPGAAVSDDTVITAEVQKGSSGIKEVDFIGYYEDFDWEGDGRFRQWHYQYQYGKIHRHLGTAAEQPYVITWDSSWVPDQDQPMKIRARITDEAGITYLTPEVDNVLLVRPRRSVKMYKSCDVPEVFGSYRTQKCRCSIKVPDSLNNAKAAHLVISTWSGEELSEIRLNGKAIANSLGRVIDYSFDTLTLPVETICKGTNTFYALSPSDYHKAEINWPGPALLIEFESHQDKGRQRLIETMVKALKNDNWQVRTYAAETLGRLAVSSSVVPLISALEDDHWSVRAAAAKALGQIKHPDAVEPLLKVLRTEEKYTRNVWRIRKNAVIALAQINDPKAAEPLIAALQDEDNYVRAYAAYALGCIEEQRAVEPLKALLDDKSRDARNCASDALYKITGKRFDTKPKVN